MSFRIDLSVAFALTFSSADGSYPDAVQASNISNTFQFSEFDIRPANPVERFVLELLKEFIEKELVKKLDQVNIGIVQDLAGAISSNLAALSTQLAQPLLPLQAPLWAHPDQYLSLTNATLVIQLIDFVLNSAVGVDGPININFLLQSFLRNSSAVNLTALLGSRTIELAESIGGLASIDVTVLGGMLSGMDSFDVFQLFVPVSENFFSSSLRLQEVALSNFSFGLDFQFASQNGDGVSDPSVLSEQILLDLALSDFGLNFSNLLLVSSGLELKGPQYLDKGCVSSAFENVTVGALDVGGRQKSLFLQRRGDGSLDSEVGALLNNFFSAINSAYPLFVPGVVALVLRDPLTKQINVALESLLHNPADNLTSCALYNEAVNGIWADFPLPFVVTVASFIGAAVAIIWLFVMACICLRWKRNAPSTSLFLSSPLAPSLSAAFDLHVVMPAVLIVSLACFVIVMCGTSGFSSILVTFNETVVNPPPVFLFNLPNLLTQAYQAQAWANVIGLSVLGMFWMFARQVLLLLLVFVPAFKHRAAFIEFLDVFGKWVGFFFLEAMLIPVAFRLHVEPVPNVTIDLYTSGAASYFLYILGLFMSLVVGNVLAVLARRPTRVSARDELLAATAREEDEPRSWLGGSVFIVNNQRVQLKSWVQVAVSLLLVASLGLTVAAIVVDSVAFTMTGLASKLLPLVGVPLERSYSVLTVLTQYDTIVLNVSWMYVSQVCLFLTCILAPLLCGVASLALWFVPLKERGRSRLLRFVVVLRSWNFIEVYLGALLACMLSISLIGTFMVEDQCAFINAMLVEYFSVELGPDTFCYDVLTSPLLGFWLMLAAVLLTMFSQQLLVVLARASDGGVSGASTTEEELATFLPAKKRRTWFDLITEEVNPNAFRTDLQ